MTNDVKKVPELRFPEFDGEWEEDKLRDLLKDNVILEQSDGNHGELYPKSSEFTEDGIPYLAASNISNNSISYQNIKYLPLERAKQFKKGVARDGDILLAHNATVGPSVLLKTDFPFVILSTTLTLYRINKVKMDNHFFLNEIRSNNIQNQLKKLMKQTTRNQVPILLQRTMHITYPKTLAEQHKIGSFFSKLDRQIELEEQKLAKLEEQKKGYMQKIFSQELRFKDENGQEYPAWINKKLGDIGKVSMNKRIYKNETSINGEIPFYKIGTFGKEAETFISREKFEEYKNKYPYPEKGDILISASGSIGRTIEYDGEEAYYQDSNIVWLDHNDEVLNIFLKYIYSVIKWSGIEGTTIKRLYNKDILNTKIDLPVIKEQEKIGNFFGKIDDSIEKQSNKIELLKERKRGFLQKMFV